MKYKKGDKVRIVSKTRGHEFDIGAIVTIEYVEDVTGNFDYRALGDDNLGWWVMDSEIEPVEPFIHTHLGLSMLKRKVGYLLDTCKQLEYQLSDYGGQYKKALKEYEDYKTKLNAG